MPQNRGKRVRIAPYVYQDDKGISGIALVAGRPAKEKRFKLGTSLNTITAWQRKTCKALKKDAASVSALAKKGTLAGDVAAYLPSIADKATRATATILLAPWVTAFGPLPAAKLTALKLQTQMNRWIADGIAASTANHRRRELAKLWDLIHSDRPNIVRKVKRAREPQSRDRAQDAAVMAAILDEIPSRIISGKRHGKPSKVKARLLVMLWTGTPPAVQKTLRPYMVRLDEQMLQRPPRQKGEGMAGDEVPLFPQGVEAFRVWLAAGAHGDFSNSNMWKTFDGAVQRYKAKQKAAGVTVDLPDDLAPYDLRHTFIGWAEQQVDDPYVLQLLAYHANLTTTKRYIGKRGIERRAKRLVHGLTPRNLGPEVGPDAIESRQPADAPQDSSSSP